MNHSNSSAVMIQIPVAFLSAGIAGTSVPAGGKPGLGIGKRGIDFSACVWVRCRVIFALVQVLYLSYKANYKRIFHNESYF